MMDIKNKKLHFGLSEVKVYNPASQIMKKLITANLICIPLLIFVTVTCALGDVWIDKVISFDQPTGSSTGGGQPNSALGPNDNQYVSIDKPETLILQFTDNSALNGEGSDIRIYEYGGDNSYVDIYGSKDGINWVFLIYGYGNLMIDLSASGLEYVNYLKFVGKDDLGTYAGYDLDAVEALNSGEHIDSDLLGDVWIDKVVSFDQPAEASNEGGPPSSAIGPNDNQFVSVDEPETLILQFTDNSALDAEGADLHIYEEGGDNSYVDIYGSKDGINWVFLINGSGSLTIDLSASGLEYVNYLKFVGKDDLGTYAGYDLDAVEALNSGTAIYSEPSEHQVNGKNTGWCYPLNDNIHGKPIENISFGFMSYNNSSYPFHYAQDFSINYKEGDPVYAMADGKIIRIRKSGGYGGAEPCDSDYNTLVAEYKYRRKKGSISKVYVFYGHVKNIINLPDGASAKELITDIHIEKGKKIAELNNPACAGWPQPHLHLTVMPDVLLDDYYDGYNDIQDKDGRARPFDAWDNENGVWSKDWVDESGYQDPSNRDEVFFDVYAPVFSELLPSIPLLLLNQ